MHLSGSTRDRHVHLAMPQQCLVCCERRPKVRLLCGHLASCVECAAHLEECPVCRHQILMSDSIPGGYISSGSSTFTSRASSPSPEGLACWRTGCHARAELAYSCPVCVALSAPSAITNASASAAARYSLCCNCALDWVCPSCGTQAEDQGLVNSSRATDDQEHSSTTTPGQRYEKCYACSSEWARFKFLCPTCSRGIYMVCAGCGPSFVCPRCFTAALLHLLPDSDHTPTSTSSSSASPRQPENRPQIAVQHGGSSCSTMPP